MAATWSLLRMVLPTLASASLAVTLSSCIASGYVVELANLTRHPSFDAAALRRAGIAVLGFERTPEDLTNPQKDRFDYPLFEALQSFHPKLPRLGAKTLRRALTPPIDLLIRDMLASDRVSELPYAALRTAAHGCRFLLSANLQSNEVVTTRADSDEQSNFCSTRAIAVRYRIVDLQEQRVSWQGVIRQSAQDCNRNPRSNEAAHAKLGGGRVFAALLGDMFSNAVTGAVFGTFPEPPGLLGLTDAAAHDLARVLPGAEQPRPEPRPTLGLPSGRR